MNLINDYFLLYHGVASLNREQNQLVSEPPFEIDEKIDDETFFEVSSLFLSTTRNNFQHFFSLQQFKFLQSLLSAKEITTLEELYFFQRSILHHLIAKRGESDIKYLHNAFEYLLEEKVLDTASYEKLLSLFETDTFIAQEVDITKNKKTYNRDFKAIKQDILVVINELSSLFEDDELHGISEYLDTQTFSVGITGVMNAGKSTMLNALMGKEVLGTSVVPETANLTVIRYSNEPNAKVIYWNKEDWDAIVKSAQTIDAMALYVKESQENFGEKLDDYILETSRHDEINVNELCNYTSAKYKMCNLVKYVELGSELHFLHDGVEIVDTPGLDDIVIQREEITKKYISECDVMLHLMNVSQSATSKDIEFIIDAVLYQNVSKILIVITRADMVSKKNVEEVIEYTKKSIASRLHDENATSKLDFILKSIHFVAISGKMALLHKTGAKQEALDAGYTLEDTGIVEVENYLNKTLFGEDSQRGEIIIHSAKQRLKTAVSQKLETLNFELSLLNKSESELELELEVVSKAQEKDKKRLSSLKEQIVAYEEEMQVHLKSLTFFIDNELVKLQSVIKKRLIDETFYLLEKKRDKITPQRVKTIVSTALKHGIVDILRDYRYEFIKKSSKISGLILHQYEDLNLSFDTAHKEFNAEQLFGDSFKQGFLTQNSEAFILRLEKLALSASLKAITVSAENMTLVIKEEFISIELSIKERVDKLSQNLLEEFFIELKLPLQEVQKRIDAHLTLLKEHLETINDDESKRHERSLELHKKIKNIEIIFKRCY